MKPHIKKVRGKWYLFPKRNGLCFPRRAYESLDDLIAFNTPLFPPIKVTRNGIFLGEYV